MRLTEHFTLDEMTASTTATRLGITNLAPEVVVARLAALCVHIWEPVRAQFGPVRIHSGYRCAALNAAVGGVPDSQHVLGEAGDASCPGVDNMVLAAWIRDNLAFDQLILEAHHKDGPETGWVHASYREGQLRAEVLTMHAARYVAGLVEFA